MVEVVIASGNPGKVDEIREILQGLDIELIGRDQVTGWTEPEETGETYRENALIKAEAALDATGKAALADDSGIEVDHLGGEPGVRSARFAGPSATDEQNNAKLAGLLSGVSPEQRTARYRCVALVAFPDGTVIEGEGACEGVIGDRPRGAGGFGYDPWFIPEGKRQTMAELTSEEKHAISHRGRALRQLAERLREAGHG